MNIPEQTPVRSRGIALIVSLLLLLVLTMLGIASMSGVTMQERMASNANLQALAFEAASVGITETLEWGSDSGNWPLDADGNPVECRRGDGNFLGEWVPALSESGDVLDIPGMPDGFRVEYRKRLGCFEHADWELITGSTFDPPQQLLALSRGEVIRESDNAVLSMREIEVRLEERGGNPTCLMQTGPLDQIELTMPNSKSFGIDARPDSCPIKTSRAEDAAAMRGQLRENQIGQYQPTDPGITSGELEGAWGNAPHLSRAVNAMKIGVRAYQDWEALAPISGPNPFASCSGVLYDSDQDWGNSCGHTVPGGLYYIAGDLDVGGNCTLNGTIISEGRFLSNGTPAYLGDMMFLGGVLDVRGFGNAGNSGLFLLHNLWENSQPNSERAAYLNSDDADFLESDFIIRGGGNATIEARECGDLTSTWEGLNQCLDDLQLMVETPYSEIPGNPPPHTVSSEFEYLVSLLGHEVPDDFDMPDLLRDDEELDPGVRFPLPDCDPEAGGRRFAIASWREFIDRGRWDN